ncbi:MAG: serpin family protein [Lachnospiraceae bacterium]|nr:serpin family protein [Lachnospiraceae bacterium]
MKRKLLTCLLIGVCLFSGCAKGDVTGEMENSKKVQKEDVVHKEKETKEVKVVNLTANNATEICLDYEIKNYEPIQRFGYELFALNTEKENPVISPVSAYLALALAGKGAEGETKKAFLDVLPDLECIPHDLMHNLPRDKEGMLITLNNSAWVDYRLRPKEEWLAWADSVYRSEVFQASLGADNTYQTMNRWIEEKTNGMIDKLFEEPLSDDARLVLLNTLYFKGKWANAFEGVNTREDIFSLENGTTVNVDMMNKGNAHLLYVENKVTEGVILPYQDENMVFLALKPKKLNVREMYDKLNVEDINTMLEQEETTLCNLKLPKFEVEFHKELNESLKQMGLEIAFIDGAADFSGIGIPDDGPNMYIEKVQQKSKIVVDEEGTEAAAVTSVEMFRNASAYNPKRPIDIYFDEPFLYMIMDKERKVPLFVGIMDNPGM